MGYLIGVDLGGTKISSAISDLEGNVLHEVRVHTEGKEGEEKVMGRILDSISKLMEMAGAENKDIISIGVGTPGIIDKKKGEILRAYNLPFKNYNLLGPIKNKFQCTCTLENDASAAALGEFLFGQGRGMNNLIYLTISTGVGGAAIIDGKLQEGSTGNAFEPGHMIIDPRSSVQCNCGLYGDVEALASGTAITKRAMEAMERGEETLLSAYESVSPKEVHEAYLHEDEVSMRILDEAFFYTGITVANLISLYNPEVLVIGGGVSFIGDLFFRKVKETAKRSCLIFLYDACEIMPSGLGEKTGVMGALAVAKISCR